MTVRDLTTDETLDDITWMPIPGFEGLYDAMPDGLIRRSPDAPHPRVGNARHGRLLSLRISTYGYRLVHLKKGGKDRTHFVHRIIAATFIGPPPPGTVVNHINCVKDDNRAQNLEYVTNIENLAHAFRNGRTPSGERHRSRTKPESILKGERNGMAKLATDQVLEIRRLGATGITCAEIAPMFGVTPAMIVNILAGRAWRHVGGPSLPFGCDARGTRARGERSGRAKLTSDQVAEIRRLRSEGQSGPTISAIIGISLSQVYRIAAGQNWA